MKIKWEFIVIIALLGLFVFRECSRPEPLDFGTEAFKDTIEVLRQEKGVIQSRQEATVKRYVDRVRVDSLNLALQNARIKSLQTKLTNQRPKVIEKIQADTAVLSYVETLEEIVNEQQVQIDTLKAQKEFQRKLTEQLIFNEITEDKIESQMAIETSIRISDLERSTKKKERKSRLAKVLIPVAAIVGLLVGAAL